MILFFKRIKAIIPTNRVLETTEYRLPISLPDVQHFYYQVYYLVIGILVQTLRWQSGNIATMHGDYLSSHNLKLSAFRSIVSIVKRWWETHHGRVCKRLASFKQFDSNWYCNEEADKFSHTWARPKITFMQNTVC